MRFSIGMGLQKIDFPGKGKHPEPPGIHPTEIPRCHRPLHHWADSREPETLKVTFFSKLLGEDLSHEPVCSRNKSPFKAGKSQAESVRYPNVALS